MTGAAQPHQAAKGSEFSALDAAQFPRASVLSEYLLKSMPALSGPIEYFPLTGGHANLTYLARAGDSEFVIKCEPPGVKAKSAHDMTREYRMLEALQNAYPLAPEAMLLCKDLSILGTVFCVMERIRGIVIRRAEDASAAGMPKRFEKLIDALADLHLVNVDAVGLGDFGKPDGYRRRQIEGWARRLEAAQDENQRLGADVAAWLKSHEPDAPQRAALIHNDFKMDNLVWDEIHQETLSGVLDWEMATVGDPIMDLAGTLSWWLDADDPAPLLGLRAMPSAQKNILTRAEAVHRYSARTGISVGDFTFYRCFGLFRRAVIEQQKFHRYATGQSADPRYAHLDQAVDVLLNACRDVIETKI